MRCLEQYNLCKLKLGHSATLNGGRLEGLVRGKVKTRGTCPAGDTTADRGMPLNAKSNHCPSPSFTNNTTPKQKQNKIQHDQENPTQGSIKVFLTVTAMSFPGVSRTPHSSCRAIAQEGQALLRASPLSLPLFPSTPPRSSAPPSPGGGTP